MVFPNSNLPATAQPWARDVQKRIEKVESNVKANELNNTARDVQLENNYKRIDATVNGLIVADAAAATALAQANTAIGGVSDIVNTIYVTGTETINGAVVASGTLSASKITTGTLSGDRITGGTITGTTITGSTLATSGNRHVEISGTSSKYFGDDGNQTSAIFASGNSGEGLLTITNSGYVSGGVASVELSNGNVNVEGGGCTMSVGNFGNNQISLSASNGIIMNSPVTFSGGFSGAISTDGAISTSSTLSVTNGIYGYSNASITGTVTAGGLSVGGNSATNGISNTGGISSTGGISTGGGLVRTAYSGGGTSGASFDNNGNLIRTASSERYKQDIQDVEYDYNSVIGLQPKSFRLKSEAVEDDDSIVYPGFIAEELAGTPLDIFVRYETLQDGTKRPDGIHYAELTSALLSAIKHQDGLIKSLTARIEVLESKV